MSLASRLKAMWGKLDESWRVAITLFLVIRTFYALWSWIVLTVQPVAVHYIEVRDEPAVIFLDLHTAQSFAYLREVNGQLLTFRAAGNNRVTDLQTGSLWDIHTGAASEGYFKRTGLSPTVPESNMFAYFGIKPYRNAWLGLWQRFDAIWYTSIAEYGYGAIDGDYAFPPFFPLLIRFLKPVFGDAFLTGLFLSHITTLYALKLLYEVFVQWSEGGTAQQTLVFFLLFPSSFFLFSVYTEPLFLVLAILSMKCMQDHKWLWAGFWTFLAILTRLQGIALFAPMLYLMWKDAPFLRRVQHWSGLLFAGSGFLLYAYLRSIIIQSYDGPFSDPAWQARLVPPWEAYLMGIQNILSGMFNYIDLLNWLVTTLFMILLVAGWRKIPLEYNLYSSFSFLVILTRVVEGQPLLAMLRYSLTLFPIFFSIEKVTRNPWLRRIIIYTWIALNLYLSAEFFGWGYVA